MYHQDVELQIVMSLVSGILFGGLSKTILFSLVFIFFFEFMVFQYTSSYPPTVKTNERFLINIVFILGWIIGRVLILNETGLEDPVAFFLDKTEVYFYPEDDLDIYLPKRKIYLDDYYDSFLKF